MRSQWKVPYIDKLFFKKNIRRKKSLRLRFRNSAIPKKFIKKRLKIYNGIWFITVFVKPDIVGTTLGEFSFSRRVGERTHLKEKRKKKSATTKRKTK